ncbi:MAG TPA: hypothetical protein VK166_17180, partial [Chitinophagaceae bacterium]|nr:hypothetical protein [Chitinophagaceae bacterium]
MLTDFHQIVTRYNHQGSRRFLRLLLVFVCALVLVGGARGEGDTSSRNATVRSSYVLGAIDCPVIPGTISGDQTVCSGGAVSSITSTASATETGATTGFIEYQWESSSDFGVTWVPIASTNSATYSPSTLVQTFQYRRSARLIDGSG